MPCLTQGPNSSLMILMLQPLKASNLISWYDTPTKDELTAYTLPWSLEFIISVTRGDGIAQR